MKLYIAGPMTGLPEFNYPAFRRAVSLLTNHGYEVESPHVNGETHDQDTTPWETYIRLGLLQLLNCEAIALLDGWEKSRGVAMELYVARAIKMPAEPIQYWIGKAVMPKHRSGDEG